MKREIGEFLGVGISNYAHILQQILTERKTSCKHKRDRESYCKTKRKPQELEGKII